MGLSHTVSGDIASFRTPSRVPIESLKFHFLPKQEGSGDPSPTNIRPITGWTGLNGKRAGKNIFNIVPLEKTYNSTYVEWTIVGDTITGVVVKEHQYGTASQLTIKFDIPSCFVGQYVWIGCTDVTAYNVNHKSAVICEFKDSNGSKITDPTIVKTNDGANSRNGQRLLIPEGTVRAELYFRIAQNASTYNPEIGDGVVF